jgi:cytoskeletal protein RodZ
MTRLFNRKKNNKTTIAELEEYYANQNQKKSSTWRTWLMAIISVIITALILVLLFLAGRWLYQVITDTNADNSTTSESTTSDDVNVDVLDIDGDTSKQEDNANNTDTSNDSNDTSDTSSNNGTVSDQAATTDESNADRVAASNDNSGATAGSSVSVGEQVPDTGAGDILVLLPLASGVLGYFVYRKKQIKKYN